MLKLTPQTRIQLLTIKNKRCYNNYTKIQMNKIYNDAQSESLGNV